MQCKWIFVMLMACGTALAAPAQDTSQKIIPGRYNSEKQKTRPYVILISADGFRYDLARKYQASNILRLAAGGVKADFLQPSYPSLTFPNHYTLVTGLYPAHHGIVDNSFYDPEKKAFYRMGNRKAVADSSWYGGDPLWVLAERQHMLSASFYWVGSEAAIRSIRPTYYFAYNEAIPMDRRIAILREWLQKPAAQRPHFITFYFPEVDHQEHRFGVDSKQTQDAVRLVDESVGRIVNTLDSLHLPVNYIFVSDHGMVDVDTTAPLPMPRGLDTTKFLYTQGLSIMHLYAKKESDILPAYRKLKKEAKDYDVFLSTGMPGRWHYSKAMDLYGRIGDIILVPHMPKIFNIHQRRTPLAEHGYDPAFKEMHATFYAWGPAFKTGQTIRGFANIHVYPLVAKILGLKMETKVDGDPAVLQGLLK